MFRLELYDRHTLSAILPVEISLRFAKYCPEVTGYKGEEQLGTALENAEVVIIRAGIPRKTWHEP